MLEALSRREIEYGVVATETLLSSTTRVALDRVMSLGLEIVGEVRSEELVCVCALRGTKLRAADCVMSDWRLLSRFEEYILQLEGLSKQVIYRHVAWDSATACRIIREEQAENTLVLCSKEAAIANGLSVLVDRIPGHQSFSKYSVIGRRGTPHLPFEGLRTGANEHSCELHWSMLLSTDDEPNWMEIVRVLGLLNVSIDHFSIRSNRDDTSSTAYACVVSFRSASSGITKSTLNRELAAAAVSVCYLGKYTAHAVRGT